MRMLLPFVVLTTLSIACNKDDDNPNAVNSSDKNFLIQTFQAARAEIKAGGLALINSNSSVVQNFSQRVITDYRSMQSDIKAVADKINFALTDTVALTIQSANNVSGYSFDTAYIRSTARNQINLLSIFQNETNTGNNTYVRHYFLNKYVDMIKAYYLEADSIFRTL
jgi:predicted outer membrane protein